MISSSVGSKRIDTPRRQWSTTGVGIGRSFRNRGKEREARESERGGRRKGGSAGGWGWARKQARRVDLVDSNWLAGWLAGNLNLESGTSTSPLGYLGLRPVDCYWTTQRTDAASAPKLTVAGGRGRGRGRGTAPRVNARLLARPRDLPRLHPSRLQKQASTGDQRRVRI